MAHLSSKHDIRADSLPRHAGHSGSEATPHLLLVNLGTPASVRPDEVRAFLDEFLSDPAVVDWPKWIWKPVLQKIILRSRPQYVAHQYAAIWTDEGSPLRAGTERMVRALEERANGTYTASAAYRYGEPSLDTEMQRLAATRTGPIYVIPLFPQRTEPTTGSMFRWARGAAERAGISHRVHDAYIPPDDEGYVEALVARWRESVGDGPSPDHLVVSFHGIPIRYDKREQRQYSRDCEATANAFLNAIDWPRDRATIAYQSTFGPEKWLQPTTATVIEQLGRRGERRIAVTMPGFLTDGLETIEEIGVRARESFVAAGGEELIRVRGPEEHPAMIASLERLAGVKARAERTKAVG